jgi:hypothetical protein
MAKRKSSFRRIVKIPKEYLEAVGYGNLMFPSLFQFENGLRLALDKHLTVCYGDWWNLSLKTKKPDIWQYAEEMKTKLNALPWIGASARVSDAGVFCGAHGVHQASAQSLFAYVPLFD